MFSEREEKLLLPWLEEYISNGNKIHWIQLATLTRLPMVSEFSKSVWTDKHTQVRTTVRGGYCTVQVQTTQQMCHNGLWTHIRTYISAYNLQYITHIYFMADIRTVCINMVQYSHSPSIYVSTVHTQESQTFSCAHCVHMRNHYALIRFVQTHTQTIAQMSYTQYAYLHMSLHPPAGSTLPGTHTQKSQLCWCRFESSCSYLVRIHQYLCISKSTTYELTHTERTYTCK